MINLDKAIIDGEESHVESFPIIEKFWENSRSF
jgi:hypothetical protein